MYPLIVLKPKKEFSVQRFHPWVFSGAIDLIDDQIKDGDFVQVVDHKHNFLAYGVFQERGSISVRLMSFDQNTVPDTDFIQQRLYIAFALRQQMGLITDHNTICRLVHGEGDGLPGLIIDFYNHHFVIQAHSTYAYQHLNTISDAIHTHFGTRVKSIYSKSEETMHSAKATDEFLFGSDANCIALENGIKYNVDWVTGQKTGFFIDQRENRSLLRSMSEGKRVLNTFSYSGGFSLSSSFGGATEVVSLDSSEKALELAKENYAINSVSGEHRCIHADALDYVKSSEAKGYDIVILDPPAFAKHQKARHNAIQAYKRLNVNALKGIKHNGYLMTFSCSQVIDKYLFQNTITAAAIEAKRNVKIITQMHQPACHPINVFHPEGEYLKGLLLHVS